MIDGARNSRILVESTIEKMIHESNDYDQLTFKETNPFAKFSFQPFSNQPNITIIPASHLKITKPNELSQHIPSP